jgi:hypothetical protein
MHIADVEELQRIGQAMAAEDRAAEQESLANEPTMAVLQQFADALATCNREVEQVRQQLAEMQAERDEARAALGRAMAAVQALVTPQTSLAALERAEAEASAVLADPQGQAAAERWRAMEAALRFYAEPGNWKNGPVRPDRNPFEAEGCEAMEDRGKLAQEALGKGEQG